MADFIDAVTIRADAEAVRRLLTERADLWWTTNAVIDPSPGGVCEFRFPDAGFYARVKVVTNRPGRVEWTCFDSEGRDASGKALNDWVDSTIVFEIDGKGDATELELTHSGLGPSADYYRTGFNVWGFYLDSLKAVAERGEGQPFQGGAPGDRGGRTGEPPGRPPGSY